MNVFIVYWHPEPHCFNNAMFNKAIEIFSNTKNTLKTSNLYEMQFDPVSSRKNFTTVKNPEYLKLQLEEMHATEMNGFSQTLEQEIQKLEWCDLMLWQFPLWWFGLPATFKGWVERVFAMGRTYGIGKMYGAGVFRGKKALISLTTGGPQEAYLKNGSNGDINAILKPILRGMLQFVGFDILPPHIVYSPAHMDEARRKQALNDFAERLVEIQNESPIDIGRY